MAKMAWSPVLQILGSKELEQMDKTPYVEEPLHFKVGERIIDTELHKAQDPASISWLTGDQIVRVHDEMISTFGGEMGVLDRGKVETALERAKHSAVFELDPYPTIVHKAAVIMHQILLYHPFADGQKRTGLSSAFIFLGLNRYSLWSRNVTEEVHFAIEVAKGEHEVEEIAPWLADRIAPPSGLGASEIEALIKMAKPPDRQCHRCHQYISIKTYAPKCSGCGARYIVSIRCLAMKETPGGAREFRATVGLERVF